MTYDSYVAANKDAIISVLTEFEARELPLGFISNNQEANERILEFMAASNSPMTLQSVEAAVKAHVAVGHRLYLSPEETRKRNQDQALYDVRQKFNAESLSIFDAWVKRQRHIAWTPQSQVAVLQQLSGRPFNEDSMNAACGRAAYAGQITEQKIASTQPLTPHSANPKLQHDSIPASEVFDCFGRRIVERQPYKLSQQAQAVLDAEAERAARQPETQGTAYWKDQAERAAQANNHARKLELSRIVITNPDRTINWEATAKERKKMQDQDPSR
jgi:hypothetical protein